MATIAITSICGLGLLVVLLGSIPECSRRRLKKKRKYHWRHAHKLRDHMRRLVSHVHANDPHSLAEQGMLNGVENNNGEQASDRLGLGPH